MKNYRCKLRVRSQKWVSDAFWDSFWNRLQEIKYKIRVFGFENERGDNSDTHANFNWLLSFSEVFPWIFDCYIPSVSVLSTFDCRVGASNGYGGRNLRIRRRIFPLEHPFKPKAHFSMLSHGSVALALIGAALGFSWMEGKLPKWETMVSPSSTSPSTSPSYEILTSSLGCGIE